MSPEYIGERSRLARISAWVAGVVVVMWQAICGVVIRSVMNENGGGGSSPGWLSSPAQSIVVPSSRGGVPVLSRPSAKPARARVCASPCDGGSPTRPAGIFSSPIWIRPLRKVPVVNTTRPAATCRPSPSTTPQTRPSRSSDRSSAAPSAMSRPGGFGQQFADRPAIELAVGLRARPAHRRALAAVQDAELDAGPVDRAPHDAVERIDLAHQMPLAEPADRRIARHLADRRPLVGQQQVRAPIRAAAAAASQPACPPPTTTTS